MIECIPNVSEGRDGKTLELLTKAIESVSGVRLLHRDVGRDAHRTVFTFVGERAPLRQAVLNMYDVALERIDLRIHVGPHPRIGAVDVCPFVPLSEGSGVEAFAPELGQEIAERFQIPVFLYERSAKRPERKRLFDIRRGEFEGLREKLSNPEWCPDFGPSEPHPSFGATVIGHRDFLVAFNVSLKTNEISLARSIAREVRELRGQGMPEWDAVRAIAWSMPSYGCVQVSLNIVDIDAVSLVRCYGKIQELAEKRGISVVGSELIGLVPERMLKKCLLEDSELKTYEDVSTHLGLDTHSAFVLRERVLEFALEQNPSKESEH